MIRVDPDRLRSYNMSPDDVIKAVTTGNVIMPSGSVNIGDETRISPMNAVVSRSTTCRTADSHGAGRPSRSGTSARSAIARIF